MTYLDWIILIVVSVFIGFAWGWIFEGRKR